MRLTCPRCSRALELSGERPSFCAYCGAPLSGARPGETTTPDPGATLPPRASGEAGAGEDAVPEVVGGYRLLRPLGGGGMGTVYEAEEASSGRRVALKLIGAEFAGSPDAVERFRQEGRLASAIAHPRCVFVVAADEEAGRPYIVMELMPGSTLDDLVRAGGPLSPEKAIAAILDVIDGLEEAHRHGVVHRDVKPSNCFLDAEGRAKVGDFGLAKSLVASAHLTRTGAFLGTPLYASPEQIKSEPVDQQTDVYSTAATLYFLLTGRAPFQSNDPAAVVARIVSDPAPSLRALLPAIDPRLDQVVLRGLERNRARRWRDLAQFRAELRQFLPGQLSIGGMGIRFGAALLDYLVIAVLSFIVTFAVVLFVGAGKVFEAQYDPRAQAEQFWGLAVWVAYFGVLEGVWGASPGKWLLRLRVWRAGNSSPPGLARGLARAVLWTALINSGTFAWVIIFFTLVPPGGGFDELAARDPFLYLAASVLPLAGAALGVSLMVLPMRRRNGYRGLHEFLTGTRVVLLPAPVRARSLVGTPRRRAPAPAEGCPERVGPYVVRGLVGATGDGRVLAAEDAVLGREVWVWLRPAAAPPLSDARRRLSRIGRLRWLASGTAGDARWEAFIAPVGTPLADVVGQHGRFDWPDVRPFLEGLTEELTRADEEGTLPETLRPGQVWVQPNGAAQLLDPAFDGGGPEKAAPAAADDLDGKRRATALLAQVSALALEGAPRPAPSAEPVRAPLPGHAAEMLGGLLRAWEGGGDRLTKFRQALERTGDRRAEVTRGRRAAHLALLAAFLLAGCGCCVFPAPGIVEVSSAVAEPATLIDEERSLANLENGTWRDFTATALGPDPSARWAALAEVRANQDLADRLRARLDSDRRRWEDRRRWLGPITRQELALMEHNFEQQSAAQEQSSFLREIAHFQRRNYRLAAEAVLLNSEGKPAGESAMRTTALVGVVAWPAVWVVWAFLWRGGLSYRILGIDLVRADGRPAPRVQCAWRALLVWAPVAGLLALSLWAQARFWAGWAESHPDPWLHTLSGAAGYAAFLVMGGYVPLALLRPARAPHDRLAGTYLVPR